MDALDFGTVYERYRADVFRFALYLTGNRADAEDIASEAFVRAWTAPGDIRVGTVRAYLFMIARNLGLDRLRRARHEATENTSDRADPRVDPETAAIDRDELRAVLARLAQLPETDRAALLMRTIGDLPYEAIAAALNLTVGAARVRVHRARAQLGAVREQRKR